MSNDSHITYTPLAPIVAGVATVGAYVAVRNGCRAVADGSAFDHLAPLAQRAESEFRLARTRPRAFAPRLLAWLVLALGVAAAVLDFCNVSTSDLVVWSAIGLTATGVGLLKVTRLASLHAPGTAWEPGTRIVPVALDQPGCSRASAWETVKVRSLQR